MEVLFLSVLIGIQFLLSGWAKFRDSDTFTTLLKNYPLSEIWRNKISVFVIIIFEILLGLCLLSLQGWIVWYGFLGAFLFVFCANILLFIRLVKGEKRIKCGCGESLDKEENVVFLLIRNNLLLAAVSFGLISEISAVSLVDKTTLTIYLSGIGLLAIIKLFFAGLRAITFIKQWKAVG